MSAELDWERRHALMRTHSALHVLCGVIWRDYQASVTGGNMEPLSGRMDFEFETMAGELVAEIERRVNDEIAADREIRVAVLPREEAFAIPDLIRTKINLLPEGISEVRTIEIVGLDLQADGGTHVARTVRDRAGAGHRLRVEGPHQQAHPDRGRGRLMETWEAVNSVRVVRDFADRPITQEHLERILNAGRRAGSSKNRQDWAFVVVRDRKSLGQLSKVGRYAGHLASAPAAIALVRPDARDEHQLRTYMWDLGRAAQNMVLAAWELGIGSVPATVYDLDLAGRLLGLPGDQRCDFLLSFGYPADADVLAAPNKAGGRVALAEVVHEERW